MKRVLYLAACLLALEGFSQAPFWTENFGTNCSQGTYANGFVSANGTWTVVSTGNNDQYANKWFVSAMEAGAGIGNCGSDCSGPAGTNRTLHVGWDVPILSLLDDGSVYSAGNGFFDSNMRVQSPVINCTGQNNISVSFAYILGGIPNADYFEVQYSANGGATWTTIGTPAMTNNTVCGGQGLWTGYTLALPASANNNNNVKIGFRWQNTDNTGADPSVAIDDIALQTTTFSPTFTLATPICAGSSVNVVAMTAPFVASGYTWAASPAGPNVAAPNASATAITFTSSGTFSITLTAISGGTTVSKTNTIVVNTSPVITASVNPAAICSGQSSTLTAGGGVSYTWNPGNLTGTAIVVSPTTTATYTVLGIGGNSCTASSIKTVVVNSNPVVTITPSSNTICAGSSATLIANGANAYTWNPGALTGSLVVITPSANTDYTALGTSSAACSGTAAISLTVTNCNVGLNQMVIQSNAYNIYPNPTSDRLYIQSNGNPVAESYEITDAIGRVVMKGVIGSNNQAVQVSGLPSGIYLMKIYAGKESKVIRFIKE